MYQNAICIYISWWSKIFWFPVKNADVSRTQGVHHVFIYFLDLVQVRYNCAKFDHCRICVTDFKEGGLSVKSPPPTCYQWATPKRPILNRVKNMLLINKFFLSNYNHEIRMMYNSFNDIFVEYYFTVAKTIRYLKYVSILKKSPVKIFCMWLRISSLLWLYLEAIRIMY